MEKRKIEHSEIEPLVWIPRSQQVEAGGEINQIMQDYGSIINIQEETKTIFQTFLTSAWTSFAIVFATIPLALLMISALYFDMNTTNICFEHIYRGYSLPRNVLKWVLAGQVVEVMALHFWFQLALILMFTWRELEPRRHILLISFLQGIVVSLYKILLFTQNVDFTLDRYRYTGNVVFLLGVLYTGYVVSKRICQRLPGVGLKKLQVFKITAQYFLGSIFILMNRYLIIPWFVSESNDTIKAIIAVVVLFPALIPNIINEKIAISSCLFIKTGRNFVLISFFEGVTLLLFSIMQAEVGSIEIFTALSLYRGVLQIVLVATEKLREKMLRIVCRCVRRCCRCCEQRLEQETDARENHERLKIDKFIQLMLYQNCALIVSQAYQALYILCNFYTKPWDAWVEPLKRVAIGSGVNLISNTMSIFMHVYWHHSRLPQVWSGAWRLHLTTVALGSVMTMLYLSVVLLTIFQGPQPGLDIKNCTVPF